MSKAAIRVLIVDDEDRFRETTAAILTKRGFEVRAVADGSEAVQEVKKDDVDVVVLDIKMPGMDGNEALREIRSIKPKLAVIMLTGHGTLESAVEGLRHGVFDYLTKPCAIDLLAQKIRDAYAGMHRGEEGLKGAESGVRDIMVPLSTFSRIREDRTVAEAIQVILQSFAQVMTTSTVREAVHRSILVVDANGSVIGIITFADLLRGLQPPYARLLYEDPVVAKSRYLESPCFSGMFTIMARDLAKKTVREIMSEAPQVVQADANLMEAVGLLLNRGVSRLLVVEGGRTLGVIREQDVVFEMAKIMREENEVRA